MVRSLAVLFGTLLVASSPSTSTAQAPTAAVSTGRVTGTVIDASGAPVAHATVTLLCSCLEQAKRTKTGKNGVYIFDGLPAGVYSLRVKTGKADVLRHIELREGQRVEATVEIPSARRADAKPERAQSKTATSGTSQGERKSLEGTKRRAPRRTRRRHKSRMAGSPMPLSASPSMGGSIASSFRHPREPGNREAYAHIDENGFRAVTDAPLSTFSADVDTASYSNMRRFLEQGQRPPKDAIRVEELINYFDYDYPRPTGKDPVAVRGELGPCPWNRDHQLVHIGLATRAIPSAAVPPRNLVFLLDVSGSMSAPDKLPLLKQSMGLLIDQLREEDRVSIVVYAGASGLVLPPTSGAQRGKIREALFALESGGSTNGAAGIELAYQMAADAFIKDGINRVILATDGDFNVGTTSDGDLTRLITRKRETGVFLSVLGFGSGNTQDTTMELLADKGNGNYAYIDDLHEGRKVLVQQAGATLVTVAKDVKLQVEFNPAAVAEYRLVGYENRRLRDEDFNDDTKDAGEMGAGHSVTALYEIVPAGRGASRTTPRVDPLKYQGTRAPTRAASGGELMTVKVRFKPPKGSKSRRLAVPVRGPLLALDQTSDDFRLAAAVTELGMLLRDSPHKGAATFEDAASLARSAQGNDPHGYRAQLLTLIGKARALR